VDGPVGFVAAAGLLCITGHRKSARACLANGWLKLATGADR
jgi:hypothetical protein